MSFFCIFIHTAQSNMVTISPQGQTVCLGESVSFNCNGTGINMEMFSPPIINESSTVAVSSVPGAQPCNVRSNLAAAIALVDSTGSSSFRATFTLYISDEQPEGQRTLSCRVTESNGMFTTDSTTFSVLGNV